MLLKLLFPIWVLFSQFCWFVIQRLTFVYDLYKVHAHYVSRWHWTKRPAWRRPDRLTDVRVSFLSQHWLGANSKWAATNNCSPAFQSAALHFCHRITKGTENLRAEQQKPKESRQLSFSAAFCAASGQWPNGHRIFLCCLWQLQSEAGSKQ